MPAPARRPERADHLMPATIQPGITSLSRPRMALTMGDPAGVGPELCLAALADKRVTDCCVPVVFGDYDILEAAACRTGQSIPYGWPRLDADAPDLDRKLSRLESSAIVDCSTELQANFCPGKVNAETGRASLRFIECAVASTLAGQMQALVTAPIHKEAIHAAGSPYPGHTEMLAALTGADRYCMMLASEDIACSLVTTHIGLCEVADALETARIQEVIELTAAAAARMDRLAGGKTLTVLGLNPHAGEGGLFGRREEQRLITPAIEAARAQGLPVIGPLPPDTAFLPARRNSTAAYICMYHDQGLIPLKMLAFDTAVNITLGLPIVRTSVDHGTGLDLAWKGRASASSLISAVRMAAALAAQR